MEKDWAMPVTEQIMTMRLTSSTYMTLCALLRDAMLVPSDASPVLEQAAHELASVRAEDLPADLVADSKKLAALQQAGFSAGL